MRIYCFTCSVLALLSLVLVVGCGTPPGVKPQLSDSSFQEENKPVRTLRVVVVTTGNGDRGKRAVRNASNLIKPQVGIKLSIVKTIVVKQGFVGLSQYDSITLLHKITKDEGLEHGKDFDIAVGISRPTLFNYIGSLLPVSVWYGQMDNHICRCFYVTKTAGKRFNSHEIMHAFIFSDINHRGGLMSAMQSDVIPGLIPGSGGGIYLLPEDRKEVLRNKWRVMNELTDEQKSYMELEDRIQTP